MSALATDIEPTLHRLPVLTLYLTERCNSRCVTCDYWQHGREDMTLASVLSLLPDLDRLGTEMVLVSGGEPLLNRDWGPITRALRESGKRVWLLTAGLALAKHAAEVSRSVDEVTVSLDGADAASYQAVRGLDAFDKVCEGIRACAAWGLKPGIRVTLQRANHGQLRRLVRLAHDLGAGSISFLALDVMSENAFGRRTAALLRLAPQPQDLEGFAAELAALQQEFAADFASGFIAESPHKLQSLLQYFRALHGLAPFPHVRCNAPQFSAVMSPRGQLQPCFFIGGPSEQPAFGALPEALNTAAQRALRTAIALGARDECRRCVCALWRDPGTA